jgi:hypothetical protein
MNAVVPFLEAGRIIYASAAFALTFDRSPVQQIRGRNLAPLIPAEHPCACREIGEPQCREVPNGAFAACEFQLPSRDGGMIPIPASCSRFRNEGHELLRITARDVARKERRRMVPEVRSHLFEPFFTIKGHGRGNGLGLTTVDSIVRHDGGCIEVKSEPGRGTRFLVRLPGGHEVAQKLGCSYPDLRVVYASGCEQAARANDSEPILFFRKPFTRGALPQKVHAALDSVPGPTFKTGSPS